MAKIVLLEIPDDCAILAAVGRIALRHSQLDYVLRLILKDASGEMDFHEAMRKTERDGAEKLRECVRRCLKDRLGKQISDLDRLLQRAKAVSDERNDLLHSVWAKDKDGDFVMRGDEGVLSCPAIDELNELADRLATLVTDFNEARLRGFIEKASGRTDKPPS
jgi:hypothetical protein